MKSISAFVMLFLLFIASTIGQEFRSVMGMPDKFKRPAELYGEELETFVNSPSGPKDKNKAWKVICDRDGYETFSDATIGNKSGKKLKFKDWYYVAEEKGSFLRLIRINGDPENGLNITKGSYVEDFGWAEKSKVLLWTSGLKSPSTGIYLKSLILYTIDGADEVIRNNNKGIKFLSGPDNSFKTAGDITLYDFYFILKKENGYYLLGRESEMQNSTFFSKEIIGWVDQNNQADWNTRLALEQNFETEAYNERKLRPSMQFVSYSVSTEAEKQCLSGNGNTSKILSKSDPVNSERNILAKSNPRRFIGTVLRMPVLKSETNYFSTGILGSMGSSGANQCPECQAVYDEISQFSNNYDILFVVEGTTSMRVFKDEIMNAVSNLRRDLTDVPNKRFGVVFYRNANVNGKSYLDITKLTDDIESVNESIRKAVFTEDSYDGYSSLYSALSKSVAKVGFKANSTNIIYVIGQSPDFRENVTLKLNCIENNCDAAVKADMLVDQLSNIRAHLVFIQPTTPQNDASNDLQEQCVDLMLEVSKSNFRSYKKVNDLIQSPKDINPAIEETGYTSMIRGGSTKNIFYAAPSSGSMSASEMASNIRNAFKDIKEKQLNVAAALEKIIDYGEQYDPDAIKGTGFDVGSLRDKLAQVLTKAGIEVNEENLAKLTDRKVNLYIKAFVPKRIFGADYSLCSPVLFFPEKELGEYLDELRALITLSDEPDDVLRTKLKETLLTLYKKYSGEKKVAGDVTLNDFASTLVGEGFSFSNPSHEFALNKIDNPKVKIETLRNFLEQLEKKYRNLEALTKYNDFEFKFKSKTGSLGKNQYYWIPFEDTF